MPIKSSGTRERQKFVTDAQLIPDKSLQDLADDKKNAKDKMSNVRFIQQEFSHRKLIGKRIIRG